MNRVDRLFAITTRLLGNKIVRATELAADFEVSRRTIYRDITALSESGVPIIALPGQGYAITEGYALPPLQFTPDEALALVIGARLLTAEASPGMRAAAASAVAKIIAIVPEATQRSLDEVDRAVDFASVSSTNAPLDLFSPLVATLRAAITERSPVLLRYVSRSRGEVSVRVVEPERLSYIDGAWYLAGYCRLREGPRSFRLERIDDLVVLPERFSARAPTAAAATPAIAVLVTFREPVSRWVREQQHWAFVSAADTDEGSVFTYSVPQLDDIVPWLLGWGAGAEILQPPELRQRLRLEAQLVVEMLT